MMNLGAPIESIVGTWQKSDWPAWLCEEWYNCIDRRIIIEPLIGEAESIPVDYKFFVFRGEIACIQVDEGRLAFHTQSFFDKNWQELPVYSSVPRASTFPKMPEHLNMMCEAAGELGKEFDFVRVDFYDLPDGPRFGEMTFSPWAGFQRFTPRNFDFWLGHFWPK